MSNECERRLAAERQESMALAARRLSAEFRAGRVPYGWQSIELPDRPLLGVRGDDGLAELPE
jgi:hypothetical protein